MLQLKSGQALRPASRKAEFHEPRTPSRGTDFPSKVQPCGEPIDVQGWDNVMMVEFRFALPNRALRGREISKSKVIIRRGIRPFRDEVELENIFSIQEMGGSLGMSEATCILPPPLRRRR